MKNFLRRRAAILAAVAVALGASAQAQLNVIGQVMANLTAVVEGRPVERVVDGLPPLIRRRTRA